VIRLSEKKKLGICIADVVGKGVPAALFMANVQATVSVRVGVGLTSVALQPRQLCGVRQYCCGEIRDVFYGVLDAEHRTMQFTSAGHPRPILKDASGEVTQLDNGGAVLGVSALEIRRFGGATRAG
jgi:sigma-B regulation protein RsbU (phosphoserine phosphatase)